jgi:hypothetical protein
MGAWAEPYEFMFGSECVRGSFWQIWDHLHFKWINTTVPCNLGAGTYHIQWFVHRVAGDTSCDGYPCMHYDVLGINGVYTAFNLTEPAGPIPAGWSANSVIQFQIDLADVKEPTVINETIQHVNFVELP